MARREPKLQRRGNIWYARVAVPIALREAGLIKQHEIVLSLKTSDYAEAKRLLHFELADIDARFTAARRKLNPAPVRALPRSEMRYMAVQLFHSREAKRLAAPSGGPDKLSSKEARIDAEDWLEALEDEDDDEARNTVNNAAKRLLSDNGFDLDTSSPDWREFLEFVRRVYREETKRTLRELKSDYSVYSGDELFQGIDGRKPLPSKVMPETLAKLIERFRKEPDQMALSPKSKGKNVAKDRLYLEYFGAEALVSEITKPDLTGLVDLLARLPANAIKLFPKMTAMEAADAAEAKAIKPMTRLTAKGYLSGLHSLMEFAFKRGIRSDNPVKGMSVGRDGVRNKDRKRPFAPDQLKLIFAAPLYSGCVDDGYGYAKPGMNHPRRGRFWVPLICLLHGLRMGEACQLHLNDIAEVDGVTVILIRASDEDKDEDEDDIEKRVKTDAGERFVPLHPEMARLGFPAYVAQMRKSGKVRLFPELTAAKATGYLSDNFSKWFANFLEKAGAKRERTSFHSFRHNYRDALREADISGERVRALGGWAGKDTSDDYGKGLKAPTLAADMAKVGLPVDLSHLHVPQPDETAAADSNA